MNTLAQGGSVRGACALELGEGGVEVLARRDMAGSDGERLPEAVDGALDVAAHGLDDAEVVGEVGIARRARHA